jgi:formylglycine-generating enzyme required for sulfatase activity
MALRGGSFATAIDVLGRDLRGWTPANNRENDVGFRVLIELREQ